MRREFMKVEITCGSDTLVSATWSPLTGFSPYHEAIRLLRQVNEKMQKYLRSSFKRGYESLEIELDDLDRWEQGFVVLQGHELFALLVTAGGVATVVQTVDGKAAELVRRLFDWMEDESE